MNINEQMNQLGQIGSVGYAPSDAVVDRLLGRTRRARAIRQGSAAVVGSVGAIGLGVVGANIFAALSSDDAAVRDRNITGGDFAFLNMTWGERFSDDYTGSDKTREEIIAAWEAIYAAAKTQTIDPGSGGGGTTETTKTGTTTSTTTCATEEKVKDGWNWKKDTSTGCEWVKVSEVEPPADGNTFWNPIVDDYVSCDTSGMYTVTDVGYYNCNTDKWTFTNSHVMGPNTEIYKCVTVTDAATGTTFKGANSNNMVGGGSANGYNDKAFRCNDAGTKVLYYKYMGSNATWSGNTCVGVTTSYKSASHQMSCRVSDELWSIYGSWSGDNGGNHAWTKNNGDGWILKDSRSKWFTPEYRYYSVDAPPSGWHFDTTVMQWLVNEPDPEPTPTPTTTTTL